MHDVKDLLYSLDLPMYTHAEADYLANAPRGTTLRWLKGYTYPSRSGERIYMPPVTPGTEHKEGASFLDLVEVVAIGQLRKRGFSLRSIRSMVTYCQDSLGTRRPLITEDLRVGGRDIFLSLGEALLDVNQQKGAIAWEEVLNPYLESLDYSKAIAVAWWPLGRDEYILISPKLGFGAPVISSTGVRVEIIIDRLDAGDSWGDIIDGYRVTPDHISAAKRFAEQRAA